MRKVVVVFLIALVVLSGMVHPAVKALSKTQTGGGVINPLFEGYLKSLQNATPDERKAILALMEALLNGTLNGDVVVSDYLKIKNAHWNGTDLIFQIWWYNGTEPALIKTYLWQNPYSALSAVKTAESNTYSVQSLEKQFLIRPLSVNFAVKIVGVDYLTNDGSGEYVYIENPSLTTVSLNGWYLLDDYAYSNQKCWANNLPRDDCFDSAGRDHVVRLSLSLAPNSVGRVQLATSPKEAILNNDGDTIYLIDKWGNLVSIYNYTASPNITIEDVSVYPVSPVTGDAIKVKIKLDNRGVVSGTGTVQVYIDGSLIATKKDVAVRRYSIREYWINTEWKAKTGTHTLVIKFIPNYKGSKQTFARTFKVLEVHPRLKDVRYGRAIENHPLRFNITAENPTGSRVDLKLTLLVDGVKEHEFSNGFLYGHSEYDRFYLIWKRPKIGYHTVTILMESSDGSTSRWEKRIYVKPNSPPSIVDLELPQWVYAGEESNGSVTVVDGDGDRVTVYVKIFRHYSFKLWGLASGKTRKFPLAPIFNRTNCREEVTVEATPIDEYGLKGKPVTETITVITDSDKDGWCNALELEYGTNPYSNDTDSDGVIDSKDVDPLRDAVVELYVFRARTLDPAENHDLTWGVDFRIEATFKAGSITRTLKEDLPSNTRDVEKMVILGNDTFKNIQKEAVAVLKFNPPDNVEVVEIDLKLVDRDLVSDDDIMDISPRSGNDEDGKVARLFFSLKNGTWWGDDYINDHKDYFGYGHLSGADDSTEDYTNGGEYDAEPFSKYYDELEALGYDLSVVNITDVKGWDGIESLELEDHQTGTLYRYMNPEEAVLFTLELPNGGKKRVLIINKRNAEVRTMKLNDKGRATSTGGVDKGANLSNVTTNTTLGIGKNTKYEATLIFRREGDGVKTLNTEVASSSETSAETSSLAFDAVATSEDIDEDDAEIWFLIKLNDEDGIPFYRELELNRELEEEGSIYRFDPSDGFGIDDPDFHQSLIEADAYGDYDGDGVPNAVELFIGKNPTLRDVLGIKLTVAVGWNANQTYLTQLVKGFQRASQVIYDYTDGYAMITEIGIKNNVLPDSEEWEESMVRIYPGTNGSVTAPIGWYWGWANRDPNRFSEYVKLFETFNGQYPDGKLYYRPIAHELGHFVFAVADEYYTKRIFYIPKGKLEVIGYDNITAELSKRGITFRVLPTIMESPYEFTEFSTPDEYEWFNAQLGRLQNTLVNLYRAYGWYVNSWGDFTTSQWGDLVYSINGDKSVSPMSAWKTVFALLSRNQTLVIESSNGWAAYVGYPMNAGLILDLNFDNKEDSNFPQNYVPKTGPYTGVGYYMIVRWGELR